MPDPHELRPARLLGRCANGSERDGGTVVHLASGPWGAAMCGRRPGRTSGGWGDIGVGKVTCKRCLAWVAHG